MSLSNPSSLGPTNIVTRVAAILFSPRTEWDLIEAEPATIGGVYWRYVNILAAIPPLSQRFQRLVFGYGDPGVSYRLPLITNLLGALVDYVASLGVIYVFALVIDGLAPSFGGQKSQLQAFKVAAYAGTAAYIAGIFAVLPAASVLNLLGLYSVYLLYLGLPKLMKVPPQQALGYTAVVTVAAILVLAVSAAVTLRMRESFGDIDFGMLRAAQNGSMGETRP
jgi:hypothetical protein